MPRATGRRLVRYAGMELGCSLDFAAVERVLELAASEAGRGTVGLPGGGRVVRSFDRLRFMTAGGPMRREPVAVSVPGNYEWAGSRVCLDVSAAEPVPGGCVRLKLSGAEASSAPLVLRGWRAGDHYQPAGHFRDQKLKEMFQEARIPSWRRDSWPILCQGTEILWARQFGAAADRAAGASGRTLCVWEEKLS